MALKALMLKKKISDARKSLTELETREAELATREAELEKSIEEAESEEERAAVDEAIGEFEADKAKAADEREGLEKTIADLESELAEEERNNQNTEPIDEPAQPEETRKADITMARRNEFFERMTVQERTEFVSRDDVKAYLGEVREAIAQKRALTNVGLTIPQVMLGLLRENILNYSKLYRHVDVRPVSGNGRAVVMGAIPEAIWTDCCGNLNELDLAFADVELGCWKVGGYFAVCNATLEDSDIDLASELMTALGQAIGKALDKAILYGSGSRMPLGIVTRLAQTSEPAGYPATARPWQDLHTTNIFTTSATGQALFQAIVTDFGAAKGKYSRGEVVHIMNETTYTYLMTQAMSFNANGTLVSAVGGTMPVIGGVIEVISDVPDYNIISGYPDLYILAERAGEKFASSEHVKFLADQTVIKGTARYDGQPAIAEGFVVIAVNNQSASTSVSFAPDDANSVQTIALNTQAATVVKDSTIQLKAYTAPGSGEVAWTSSNTAKATVGSTTGIVTGVASGNTTITATCNGLSATCAVTVTTE